MLGVNLTGDIPTVETLQLRNMPTGFGFRPHGIHLDNVSSRLYAVCHSDLNEEESVVVFDVRGGTRSEWPILEFKYALVSPNFTYFGPEVVWFLNDVTGINGKNELLTTQFGPQQRTQGSVKDKYLWRCTWDEAEVGSTGRLPAACSHAFDEASGGLNGITMDQETARVWVNDLYTPELWVFDRHNDGSLTKIDTVPLPGVIDNVERDLASGDLQMGLIAEDWTGGTPPVLDYGGVQYAACLDKPSGAYDDVSQPLILKVNHSIFGVSTSLVSGRWALLGSPGSEGPMICDVAADGQEAAFV